MHSQNKKMREKVALKPKATIDSLTQELTQNKKTIEEQNKKITELQAKLTKLTNYDSLTGLPNRTQCGIELEREVARAARHQRNLALLYFDLDNFKKINDALGHEVGDYFLKEAARRIRLAVRTEDLVARLGDDQFAAILTDIENPHHAGVVAHRVIKAFSKPFQYKKHTLVITTSIGIAFYPDAGIDASQLEKNAEIALNSAKELDRNNYQFFTASLETKHTERLEMESALHFALERNEFYLVYQPRFDLQTERMVGMEALLRWRHPEKGMISPNDFISIAEETGLIIPIGEWVLKTACQQYSQWRKQGRLLDVIMAINVSPRQFQHKAFVDMVIKTIHENSIPPELIELEVTETAALGFLGKIENAFFQLRDLGVQFSIDDFGKGYSSLERLKELPIQSIKIDRSFVNDIDVKISDSLIVKSTIDLGKDLGLNVIAEGVETESQLHFLVKNQCPQAQGYYYSKPLTVEQMTEFLKKQKASSSVV